MSQAQAMDDQPWSPGAAHDPRWAGCEPRLVEVIRAEIRDSPDGRITFARFMQRALAEPGLGYYASSELRPTREGDFLTAPELHPFFGRCVGRFVTAAHEAIGAPGPLRVREFGAGRGTLRDDALDRARLRGGVDARRPARSQRCRGRVAPSRHRQRVP